MRRTLGIVTLTLACTALVFVSLWRFLLFDYFEERYPAALYFARIRAIDEETSKPVDFKIKWDYEAISPFIKGSGPGSIETNEDKTVTVAVVGILLKEGLPLKIAAEGYIPELISIRGDRGGFLDRPAQVEEVRLRRSASESPANP